MRKYFYLSLALVSMLVFAGCSFLDMIYGSPQPPMYTEEDVSQSDKDVQQDTEKGKAEENKEKAEEDKEEEPMIEDVFKEAWILQFSIGQDTVTSDLFVKTGNFDENKYYSGIFDTVKSSLYYSGTGETEFTGSNPSSAEYKIDGEKIIIISSDGGAVYEGILKIDQQNPSASGSCTFLGEKCSWTLKKKE